MLDNIDHNIVKIKDISLIIDKIKNNKNIIDERLTDRNDENGLIVNIFNDKGNFNTISNSFNYRIDSVII